MWFRGLIGASLPNLLVAAWPSAPACTTVAEMTELTKDEVLTVVLDSLSPEEAASSIVYWDQRVFEEGESVTLGSETLEVTANATLVFVDLEPRANWGHACAYFLIDLETREIERHPAEFPPYLDDPPPEYKVLFRYGEPPPHDRHFNVFD